MSNPLQDLSTHAPNQSPNLTQLAGEQAGIPPPISETTKRPRGRPKGSKNKPKVCLFSMNCSNLTLMKIHLVSPEYLSVDSEGESFDEIHTFSQ